MLTQGHISKVNFTVHTYQKFGPGHNSSLPCWISIFHTIVVDDPTVFHDLDPRSSAHIPKIHIQAITPHCQVGSS